MLFCLQSCVRTIHLGGVTWCITYCFTTLCLDFNLQIMKESQKFWVTVVRHRASSISHGWHCILWTVIVSGIFSDQPSVILTVSCTGLVLSCRCFVHIIFALFLCTVPSSSSSFRNSFVTDFCCFWSKSYSDPTLDWSIIACCLSAHAGSLHCCLILSIYDSTRFSNHWVRAWCSKSLYPPSVEQMTP